MRNSPPLLAFVFLLLLYPAAAAAEESAIVSPPAESTRVPFGEGFSLTCGARNGTAPDWSFSGSDGSGGGGLPEGAKVSVGERGEGGAVVSRLEVAAATMENVGEYRDGRTSNLNGTVNTREIYLQ